MNTYNTQPLIALLIIKSVRFTAGAAMIHFLVVGGCVSSFGVFFKKIQENYDCTASDVAWIPAIMTFVTFMTGKPSNLSNTFIPITNNNSNYHYYYRHHHHSNCNNCGQFHE